MHATGGNYANLWLMSNLFVVSTNVLLDFSDTQKCRADQIFMSEV